MLVIRLQRTGRTNRATFRVVLQEKNQAPKSKALEILGNYHPHLKERKDQIQLNADRIKYWLSQGAEASNTIHNMLVEMGVIEGKKKKSVKPKAKPQEEGAEETPTETPKEEAAPVEKADEKSEEEKPEEKKKEAEQA